jgi:hypothetical protein
MLCGDTDNIPMAQKRRPSKQAGFEYLTVMVPAKFRADLVKQAESEGRTLSDVTRERLLRPLAPDERQMSSWAVAIGRLMALLGDDVAGYSQNADEALANMKVAAEALLGNLLDGFRGVLAPDEVEALDKDDRALAKSNGELLAQRVRCAHEPKKRAGSAIEDHYAKEAERALLMVQPSLGKLQQAELLRIQEDLRLAPDFLQKIAAASGKQASGKGKE